VNRASGQQCSLRQKQAVKGMTKGDPACAGSHPEKMMLRIHKYTKMINIDD